MSNFQQTNSQGQWIAPTADTTAPGAIQAPHPRTVLADFNKSTHIATAIFVEDAFSEWKIQTKTEYNDEQAAIREQQELEAAEAEANRVPEIVSRFQAKAALYESNLLKTVQDYIDLETTPALVKLAWEDATFKRSSNMVNQIAGELELTSEQVDDLFRLAATIEV